MRRARWTWEEHVKWGKEIKSLEARIRPLHSEVSGKFGVTSKVQRHAMKSMESLSALKSELENELCRDFPDRDRDELLSVYYGDESPA